MKRSILIAIALILCPIVLHSQPLHGYIGLFTDDCHSSWCATGEAIYPVEMWVWCLPSINGQICSEFAVHYPSNVIVSTVTGNVAILTVTLPGCIYCEGDMCRAACCYYSCQTQWHWIFHQQLWVTDQMKSYCEIVEYPDGGTYQFYNCFPGYPSEPCIRYTKLFINYAPGDPECDATAVESKNWGAIKKLLN